MFDKERQRNLVRYCVTRGKYRYEFSFDEADAVLGACRRDDIREDDWQGLVDDTKLVCEMDERECVFPKEKAEAKERIMKTLHKYGQAQDR